MTGPKQTTPVLLALLNERVSQLMKMSTEIVEANRIRNGRLEKLEQEHKLNVLQSRNEHKALLERIEYLNAPERHISEIELATLRTERQGKSASRLEQGRMVVERPYLLLAAAVVLLAGLAGPVTTVALRFIH